ncbi:hypothetical protein OAN00_01165 [Pseudomonadales bacterium]|nr:hypothetical protein [Pseudomonadales bacterium]MDC0374165.1 hypothetical protein [Pseudomonadales bacterium]
MKTRTRGSGNKRLARASPYPSRRIILDYYRLNRADTGAIAVTLRRGAGGPLGDGCVVNPVLGRMDFVPQGRVETSITHEAAYRAILIGLAHS